jgi:hypothetical protein
MESDSRSSNGEYVGAKDVMLLDSDSRSSNGEKDGERDLVKFSELGKFVVSCKILFQRIL